MKKYLIIALLGTALSAADVSTASAPADPAELTSATTRMCQQLIALSSPEVDLALTNFDRIAKQLITEFRTKKAGIRATSEDDYRALKKAVETQLKEGILKAIDAIAGATPGAKALVGSGFSYLFLMDKFEDEDPAVGRAINNGIIALGAEVEKVAPLFQRLITIYKTLESVAYAEDTDMEFAIRVQTLFGIKEPSAYTNDMHAVLFGKKTLALAKEQARLQRGLAEMASLAEMTSKAAASTPSAAVTAPVVSRISPATPAVIVAATATPPSVTAVPATAASASAVGSTAAAVTAKTADIDSEVEFATRILARFPGLKADDYINDHHAAIFGAKTLKLPAMRAKLKAGLAALATKS